MGQAARALEYHEQALAMRLRLDPPAPDDVAVSLEQTSGVPVRPLAAIKTR